MGNGINIGTCEHAQMIRSGWERMDEDAAMQIQRGELGYMEYSFYQTYRWNDFLEQTYRHSLGKPLYVVAEVEGQTRIILPLLVEKLKKRVRTLSGRIAGILNAACPYRDEKTRQAMRELVQFLKERFGGWDVRLQDIPRHSLLAETLIENGLSCSERGSYHVPLSEFPSYEDYLSSLGKNIYKNIRKSYNHLTTDGKEMKLEVYDSQNSPSKQLLTRIWTLYFLRKLAWKHKKQSFWRELVSRMRAVRQAGKGRQTRSMKTLMESRLFVLTIDGSLAAFMHVYLHGDYALMPKLAIDVSYSRYSPGILMVLEALKQLMEQGVADFDMCRGEERYKKEVGGKEELLCSVRLS